MDTDLADCIGSLTVDNSCPAIMIRLDNIKKMFPDVSVDLTEGNCTKR